MPKVSFAELPGHGRLWVFPLSRDLTDAEAEQCLEVVDDFLGAWAAHGVPLLSARELREERFVLIGVDVDAEAPSGCSIDALVNRFRVLGDELEVSFIDHAPVWFRKEGAIHTASRADFKALIAAGEVVAGDAVFDTSLTRVEQARDGSLERPATETWHGRAFFKA